MAIIIEHEGDTWKIIGEGALRDGKVYCHLASTTRERQQRNGRVPVQIAAWIDQQVILSFAIQGEEARRKARYTDIVSDGGTDPRDRP
jgi:hypothetical protein